MRRFLRAAAILTLCLAIAQWVVPAIAKAETDWRALYENFLTGQQSQTRARRAVALIDLEGDGVPELIQLASSKGNSRTCTLGVYKAQSASVVKMTASGFDFSSYTFAGVRSASFALRASSANVPCLAVTVTGVSKGITTTTRLAFTQAGASGKLDVRLFETRATKGRKSLYTVNGEKAAGAQYAAAYASLTASYSKKGSGLPYQILPATARSGQISSGITRLAARYKAHSTVKRVKLSKASLTLAYGASYKLKASISPASAIYETCAWTSSDTGVVKVDGGVLTAVDVGSAVVTCKTSGGAKKSCVVKVSAPSATSVTVSGGAHTVVLKDTLKLSVSVLPEKASKTVKWTSDNSSVASVSNGVVTGRKMGTTTIRVTTSNGKKSSYAVTVLSESLDKHGAIIDISRWNTVSDWGALQKDVSFVILRCGVTYSASHSQAGQMDIDARFNAYASKCLEYGIPFGVYYYGMASTAEKGRQEAEKAYSIASRYHPLFYAYDAEEAVLTKASIEAFATRLKALGATKVGCYIAHHRYKQYKVKTSLFDFIWIPHYGTNNGSVNSTPSFACDLHQYSSRGKVGGINGDVDVNRLMGTKSMSFFTS